MESSATNIITRLKKLGRAELQEFCSRKVDQIIKLLPRYLLNSDGAVIVDCVLNGLPDTSQVLCRNKIKIIDLVLQTMRKESTSLIHCCDVISRVRLELPRMPPNELVRWCNDSVQSIVDDSDVNMIYRMRTAFQQCLLSETLIK